MIHFYSTNNREMKTSLRDAVLRGLAEDGGLYMPDHIPLMPDSFFKKIHSMSFSEIAFEVCKNLFAGAIAIDDLNKIIKSAINFDAPIKELEAGIYTLELFHGPTLSFKDFGARFMAQLMGYFIKNSDRILNVLVATSGDTGSAIAHAFLDVPGIRVWILYPKGKVSWIQEKQFTTLGHNITALEIKGTFDDCQSLVKQAFSDKQLRKSLFLTSANSINIARLIPQSFYYFYSYAQLKKSNLPFLFSVPCGNFGNLTAGLMAKKMGLPVMQFIASTNINDSVPRYLRTGIYQPKPTQHTLSNAMDVGNPSNFARMLDLYHHQKEKMASDITGFSFSDAQTEAAMQTVFAKYGYLLDPHGAVAYLGLQAFLSNYSGKVNGIFFETAHPAKFSNDVERITHQQVSMPKRLDQILQREKSSTLLSTNYEDLKNSLLKSV